MDRSLLSKGHLEPPASTCVQILLTNDDGIYAPGLAALRGELRRLGDVCVVAPAVEQSGVGHSITFLTPLVVKEIFNGDERLGFAVEGSPADCVKLAVARFAPCRPDVVVSGINGGLNAGINVLYSGTVAAAIEGAFFGITSIAVSLEYDEHAQFARAARVAVQIIEQILQQSARQGPHHGSASRLFNVNIPTAALEGTPRVRVVPMDVTRWGEDFEERIDPRGRRYYWATGGPPTPADGVETDLTAIQQGDITITPLHFDMTERPMLGLMREWEFRLS
jgi:5'-nucleotidase